MISQKLRLIKIDEARNCFIEEIKQNDLNRKGHIKVYIALKQLNKYLLQFLQSPGMFQFLLLLRYLVPIGIPSSAVGLRICVITTGIDKYKSIIKEKKKRAW